MTQRFRPSINIIRDEATDFDYLTTPNAERVFRIIADNFLAGNRAFSLLGTYGTGKSSFLLALEKQLKGEGSFFDTAFPPQPGFEFIKVVGQYRSGIEVVAEATRAKAPTEEAIIAQLTAQAQSQCTVLIIDEFGKFLEYAGKHNPERELYFIQQLAEAAAEPDHNLLLVVTLHQSFDAYARSLGEIQRNEWEKVRGRLTEVAFNEPVEQLLYIAAQRIPNLYDLHEVETSVPGELLEAVQKKNLLSLSLDEDQLYNLADQLYPMDLLSASVLAQAMQQYGQNDRSLFTFLESNAQLGLWEHVNTHRVHYADDQLPIYHLPKVYDFLTFSFYSVLTSYYNPEYFQWSMIRDSLDRVDNLLPGPLQPTAEALVKIIGLTNIFGGKAVKLDQEALAFYGGRVMGLSDVAETLESLTKWKIIRYQSFRYSYVLFEGTDIDIEAELREGAKAVEPVKDVVPHLIKHFDLPYLPAKSYFYQTGTPRFFKFELSNQPVSLLKKKDEQLDGYVNLLFNPEAPVAEATDPAILYGVYPNTELIQGLIHEIDVTAYTLQQIGKQDRIARREIEKIQADLVERLNSAILDVVFQHPEQIQWYYQGEPVSKISNATRFNQFLSEVCATAYPGTPHFRNELVNKSKPSSAVATARKKLVAALVNAWRHKDLGLPEDQYPAEKGIYLSLMAGRLHVPADESHYGFLDQPADETFSALWQSGDEFLQSAQQQSRNLKELIARWREKPFRLKAGFIDFWLPVFLFMRRDDFTLYDENLHLIPALTEDVLDLVVRKPQRFFLKSFALSGERLKIFNQYRDLTQLDQTQQLSQQGFIDTIRPFLVFYKGLPAYTKQTQRLSTDAIAFREALIKARDPEKVFFEDLPAALGYRLEELEDEATLTRFYQRIRECLRELREAYRDLVARVEGEIKRLRGLDAEANFAAYKAPLEAQFAAVKDHLLKPEQRSFLKRLRAPLDAPEDWVAGLTQIVVHKRLEDLKDNEEKFLFEKLADTFRALDNLVDLEQIETATDCGEFFELEITSNVQPYSKQKIRRHSEVDSSLVESRKEQWLKALSGNKDVDRAAVATLLRDLLNDHA